VGVTTDPDERAKTWFAVNVLAKDPSYVNGDGMVCTTKVQVPGGWLEPGPRDHRFHVVDFDISSGHPPADPIPFTIGNAGRWEFDDKFERARLPASVIRDRDVHAQQVWAIAASTLGRFEQAIGRRICWQFPCAQLFLVPHGFAEANAYYDRSSRGVFFGFVPQRGHDNVYSCLSSDVVAHEVSHAILDGLRQRYLGGALCDGLAFHEALADIVALFSAITSVDTVRAELSRELTRSVRRGGSQVISDELRRGALFGLAAELGTSLGQSGGLRRSVTLEPDSTYLQQPEFGEPHRRGEVLVAAMMRTLLAIWSLRIVELDPDGRTYLDRAAEEGATAAIQLLGMLLRAIDYMPPIDLELPDVFDAIVHADEVVVPTQRLDYREALRDTFAGYGLIARRREVTRPLLLDGASLDYRQINASSLRSDSAEVYRFLWQNAEAIGFRRLYYTDVESIHPVTRVGPDGLIHHETIVTYTQRVDGSLAGLREHSRDALSIPRQLEPGEERTLWGGGVVVFDQFGHARLHLRKPIDDWTRQRKVLDRFAAGLGAPIRASVLADLHTADVGEW
jgi:hypothetical protein